MIWQKFCDPCEPVQKAKTSTKLKTTSSSHLALERIGQEVADFPHGVLDLCLGSVLLQDAIDVADSHLAHVTEAAGLKASLVHYSWRRKKHKIQST